jgi:hypothetical protein
MSGWEWSAIQTWRLFVRSVTQERELRSAARSAAAKFQARLNGYATKKYGDDWQDRYWDLERIQDEFERYLESKEGEY